LGISGTSSNSITVMSLSLKKIFIEAQRFSREKGEKYSTFSKLQTFIQQHQNELDNYFVSYQDILKLGVNPRGGYGTAIGIYAYPLSFLVSNGQLSKSSTPVGRTRQYIFVFQISPQYRNSIIYIAQNGQIDTQKTSGEAQGKLQKLLSSITLETPEQIAYKTQQSKQYNIPSQVKQVNIQNLLRNTAIYYGGKKLSQEKTTALWTKFGILGLVDEGSGSIYRNEPTQAVFFRKDVIQSIMVVDNSPRNKDYVHRLAGSMSQLYNALMSKVDWHSTAAEIQKAEEKLEYIPPETDREELINRVLNDKELRTVFLNTIPAAIKALASNGQPIERNSPINSLIKDLQYSKMQRKKK
jgi:hypothetical protein